MPTLPHALEMVTVHNHVNCSDWQINALIGLHDPTKTRRWEWADGSPYDWTNWSAGQPDNDEGVQYCVRLLNDCGESTAMWDDVVCWAKFRSGICQLDPTT